MSRPAWQTTTHRARLRSLPALLVNKFLNEYGYDKGPVVARAIVKDILGTIEGCYDRRVGPRQCMWLAVRADRGKRRTIPGLRSDPGAVDPDHRGGDRHSR